MAWIFFPIALNFFLLWRHERYLYNHLLKSYISLKKENIKIQKKYNRLVVKINERKAGR